MHQQLVSFSRSKSRWRALLLKTIALFCVCLVNPGWAQTGTAPDEGIRFAPPSKIVITGAVVTLAPGNTLDDASILIEHGRIQAIGQFAPPQGAKVIDLAGKHIYPAIVDPFAEFDATAAEYRAGHWNASILPQRRMDQVANLDKDKLDALRRAGVAAVLAVPPDGIIKGQSCVVLTGSEPLERALLRPAAFQHIQLYPERRSRTYPNSPMGAVALLRQTFSDADWYERAQQTASASLGITPPDTNVALQELLPALRGKQTVIADGANELYALRADRLAREFSVKLVVKGSGREYRRLDAIKQTNRTFIIPVNFPAAPEVSTRDDVADATLQDLMHWRLAPENPARLEKAGVKFVLTANRLSKASELLPAVRNAIKHGLSETAALRALTIGPAEMLEIDGVLGTLEAGKLANLIVSSGPLFDQDSKIEETWVAGARFEWESRQEVDVRGEWQVVVGTDEANPLTVKLAGSPEKLTGKLGKPQDFAAPEKSEAAETTTEIAEPAPTDASAAADAASDEDPAESATEPAQADESEESEESEESSLPAKDKPAASELKDVKFNGYRLTASFQANGLRDKKGTGWLAVVLLDELTTTPNKLVGTVRWGDGSEEVVVLQLQPTGENDESTAKESTADKKTGSKQSGGEGKSKGDEEVPLVDCPVNYPLGAFGMSEQPAQPEWMLVRGATLWTCGEQGILENADMLIHRGVIAEVGQGLEAPEGAVVFDGTGLHVSPGIIDCHSHMATDSGVNESGQAITAEVRIGDFIDPNDITIYRQLAGGVTTANILHGSANPIGGQNQVIKLRWGALDEEMKMQQAPAGIKFALGENVKQSSRTESVRYPQTRMGVEQIIRDRFEAALKYRQEWKKWSSGPSGLPPRRDYELDTIAEILEGTRWVHCHSYRQDEILAMLRTLEDYGVTIGSLQHILEGYKVADAMAAHGATGSSFSDWWAYKFEVYDAIPYNGALMHNAGVVVSFNSDDDELARHLNHEAAKAVKYGGVEPAEALKFVTLNPAKQLRIDSWVGSLEPGKHADFVVWNRSPLSTLSMCVQTWIDGRKYFDREQDLAMRKANAELHQSLVQGILTTGAKTQRGRSDDDPSYWWVRFDEFCHHHHGHEDQLNSAHEDHAHEGHAHE